MNDFFIDYLSRDYDQRIPLFKTFVSETKALMRSNPPEALEIIRRAAHHRLDYQTAVKMARLYREAKNIPADITGRKLRFAILGSSTTQQLTELLEYYLFARGFSPVIYEAEYCVFRQEIIDTGSELYRFRPDLVFLATNYRDISEYPPPGAERAEVESAISNEISRWSNLWKTLFERSACQIIQNNFDLPSLAPLGSLEGKLNSLHRGFIRKINAALSDAAPDYVQVHDVEGLASEIGKSNWFDERFYCLSKQACTLDALPLYAHCVAAIAGACFGLTKKCLVLDLDNTLWGGVIGDDGLDGILLSEGTPEGEAFLAFQRYAFQLKKRGILLAICSKNDLEKAREAFLKHPDMILKLEDIACFVANWSDKPGNLAQIAKTLNIGIDSLVFADDNPAERAIVRQLAPQVAVPDMPADPADYPAAVDAYRYFEQVALTGEDLQRAEMYRQESERKKCESSAADLDSFLISLKMKAHIAPFDAPSLERIVQLINKSNQYNLTTRRRTNAEILELMSNPNFMTRCARLSDQFGNYGLISIFVGEKRGAELICDTWLMSCRVLSRQMEFELLNHIYLWCRKNKISKIIGEFLPTSKNSLVRDHYSRLGFSKISGEEPNATQWELRVDGDAPPFHTHILCEETA